MEGQATYMLYTLLGLEYNISMISLLLLSLTFFFLLELIIFLFVMYAYIQKLVIVYKYMNFSKISSEYCWI